MHPAFTVTNNTSPVVTTTSCLPATTADMLTLPFVHLEPENNRSHAKKKMQQKQDENHSGLKIENPFHEFSTEISHTMGIWVKISLILS